jgi:hypothetical protein
MFNGAACDIPLLNNVRVNTRLASVFRDHAGGAPPFHGWFGTIAWIDGAGAGSRLHDF